MTRVHIQDLNIRFGQTDYTPLAQLARSIFEMFPVPLMRVDFARDDGLLDEDEPESPEVAPIG